MSVLLSLLLTLRTLARSRAALELEVLALRHQLEVLKRTRPRRLRLAKTDGAVSTDILHLSARVVVTAADRLTLADGPQCFRVVERRSERRMIIPMTTTGRRQQRYDHRLRDLVQSTPGT